MVRAVRALLGVTGVATAVYGVRLLLEQGGGNLRATLSWLVGGVLLHDAVIGPAVIAMTAAVVLVSGRHLPAPAIVGAVVVGTVSVVAVPVLGRFGARADNPTLLDRHYVIGWTVLVGLTCAAVALALLRERRSRGGDHGARAGRG